MTLDDIINNAKSDPRELKRALVVKMDQLGISRKQIKQTLNVLDSFISRWCSHYVSNDEDAKSLLLNYKGSKSYLNAEQKKEIKNYLDSKTSITLIDFKKYIQSNYGVVYQSDQSYYDLLKSSKMSWKKTQKKL